MEFYALELTREVQMWFSVRIDAIPSDALMMKGRKHKYNILIILHQQNKVFCCETFSCERAVDLNFQAFLRFRTSSHRIVIFICDL